MLIAEYEQHIIAMTLFLYIFQAKKSSPLASLWWSGTTF